MEKQPIKRKKKKKAAIPLLHHVFFFFLRHDRHYCGWLRRYSAVLSRNYFLFDLRCSTCAEESRNPSLAWSFKGASFLFFFPRANQKVSFVLRSLRVFVCCWKMVPEPASFFFPTWWLSDSGLRTKTPHHLFSPYCFWVRMCFLACKTVCYPLSFSFLRLLFSNTMQSFAYLTTFFF